MSSRQWHAIWIEQCEAARDIETGYGLKAALDYLVTEKLLSFAYAAANHPEFARELPQFVLEVRRMFTSEEIRAHLARVAREYAERSADTNEECDDCFLEDPTTVAQQAEQCALIRELLTAPELGTS